MGSSIVKSTTSSRILKRERGTNGRASPQAFPLYARVKVVGRSGDAREVTGKEGLILGRGKRASGAWGYTVLIEPEGEAYRLPQSALRVIGPPVARSEIYSGSSFRVRVGKDGSSRKVSE